MNRPDIKSVLFDLLKVHPAISTVCFDFFDTLAYRVVVPEHTKRLASNQLGRLLGGVARGGELYRLRRDLEADICRKNVADGFDSDFNLTQFAVKFHGLLTQRFREWPDILTEDRFKDLLVKIEIAIETLVQRVYRDTDGLLDHLRDQGLRIVIVSDFYIQMPFFKHFLDFHGFSRQIDEVFVSADYGLTKASGRLYDRVISELGCGPENLLMVGDNEHSDKRMAEAKGIQAIHIDRRRQKAYYQKWDRQHAVRKRSGKGVADRIHAVVKTRGGDLFPETGVILWRFTCLLFRRLVQDGVKNVFFFSREGEFLKTLFEKFQEDHYGTCVIRAHYLLVSRKSTFICSLRPLDEENFIRIFDQYRSIAPREFLLSLNISEPDAQELCRSLSVDYEKRTINFGTSAAFIAIVRSSRFAELYEDRRRQQKKNFLAYLATFGVDFTKEGLNIVDVGWRGSIQDNIFLALDEKVAVRGYYIGLLQPTHTGASNRKTGILFSDCPVETPFFEVYNSNRSFFEMILDATHGSADGYYSHDKYETVNHGGRSLQIIQRSRQPDVVVDTLDLPEERKLFDKHIRPIQESILHVFRKINRLTAVMDARLPGDEWFARRHARMMYRPTGREIGFFENLYHLENFGIFEFTGFKEGGRLPIRRRIINFIKVCKDPGTVLQTGVWAPVILKRLGLGFYRWPFCAGRHYHAFSGGNATRLLHLKEQIRRRWLRCKPKKCVKIAFLLGIPEINGGTYVIFEHASRMRRKGYQVYILTEETIDSHRYAWHPEAAGLEWSTFGDARRVHFDFAIATWWMSALSLRSVNAATYLYFIQSIETRFFPPEDRITYAEMINRKLADKTYHMPLPIITEARWIQTHLRKNYGQSSRLVLNGIRKDIYSASDECHARRQPGKLRVLVEGPMGVHYKNVERTLEICRRSDADEIWLLTSSAVDAANGADRVFSMLPIYDTPQVYRSCDVLVKLSYIEGMFGPPLEMFHCGGTAIVYRVTGHDEYISHNVNSLVVQPDDEDGVVAYLNLLKQNPDVLERLKTGARETALKWPDWDAASEKFEKTLETLKTRLWPDRRYLNRVTDGMWRHARGDIERLKSLPHYRQRKPDSAFCQIFWQNGSRFSEADSVVIAYECGRRVSLRARISPPFGKIYLRVDPCMQPGVIVLEHILVREASASRTIYGCRPDTRWQGMEISGTASVVDDSSRLVIESYGGDPQWLLPPLLRGGEDADILVEVSMRFLPFPLTLKEIRQCLEDRNNDGTPIDVNG